MLAVHSKKNTQKMQLWQKALPGTLAYQHFPVVPTPPRKAKPNQTSKMNFSFLISIKRRFLLFGLPCHKKILMLSFDVDVDVVFRPRRLLFVVIVAVGDLVFVGGVGVGVGGFSISNVVHVTPWRDFYFIPFFSLLYGFIYLCWRCLASEYSGLETKIILTNL